jgi:hypothetical protein
MRKLPTRTILTIVASAIAAGTLSMAAVSYADAGGATSPASTKTSSAGSILPGVRGVLKALVAQGRITQSQADAVQRQADSGTIDPKSLVQSGVITDARMRLVADGIEQVKLAGS